MTFPYREEIFQSKEKFPKFNLFEMGYYAHIVKNSSSVHAKPLGNWDNPIWSTARTFSLENRENRMVVKSFQAYDSCNRTMTNSDDEV